MALGSVCSYTWENWTDSESTGVTHCSSNSGLFPGRNPASRYTLKCLGTFSAEPIKPVTQTPTYNAHMSSGLKKNKTVF